MQVLDVKYGVVAIMESKMGNKSKDIGMKVKTFIPCMLVHTDEEQGGMPESITCVGVFDVIACFDFPSLPRNFHTFLLIETPKGSYDIGMNIINEKGNILIPEKIGKFDIPEDHTVVNFNHVFRNVIFPKEGMYFFQLIVDDKVIYKYDFRAVKIQRRDYTSEEVEKILDDPETIKVIRSVLTCGCGHPKKFSLALDPEKQKEEEKLPDEDVIMCEKCGNEINIAEVKANMRIFLGTKNLMDTFNRNLKESRILAANGFLNSSLIMQVSAFEAYMRDTFMLNYKNWFIHLLDNKNELKQSIKKIQKKVIRITEQMRLKDQFYDQIFIFEKMDCKPELDEIYTYNRALKTLLFGEDEEELNTTNKIISFQQLKGEFGCFWAYKNFLGIEVDEKLKGQPDSLFDHLLKSFKIRHRIIHGSSKITIAKEIDSDLIKETERIILFIREFVQKRMKELGDKREEIEKDTDSN